MSQINRTERLPEVEVQRRTPAFREGYAYGYAFGNYIGANPYDVKGADSTLFDLGASMGWDSGFREGEYDRRFRSDVYRPDPERHQLDQREKDGVLYGPQTQHAGVREFWLKFEPNDLWWEAEAQIVVLDLYLDPRMSGAKGFGGTGGVISGMAASYLYWMSRLVATSKLTVLDASKLLPIIRVLRRYAKWKRDTHLIEHRASGWSFNTATDYYHWQPDLYCDELDARFNLRGRR